MLLLAWKMTPQVSSGTASKELEAGMACAGRLKHALQGQEGRHPAAPRPLVGYAAGTPLLPCVMVLCGLKQSGTPEQHPGNSEATVSQRKWGGRM